MALNADELAASLAKRRAASKPTASPSGWSGERPPAKTKRDTGHPAKPVGQPESQEAERGILGSMLVDPKNCIPEIHRDVMPGYFYNPTHLTVFQALIDMHESGGAIDLVTFTNYLRDRKLLDKVGGASYVTDLFTFVPTAANVRYYIEIAREKAVMRELIITGTQMVRATYGVERGEDLAEVLDHFGHAIERIRTHAGGPNGTQPFSIKQLQEFNARNDPDNLIGHRWLVRGTPSLLAGGSGYGKSSLAMQLAIFWACGKSPFNLRPVRPLKSLIIQAENDLGDMAEQLQGVLAGIGAAGDLDLDAMKELIERNIGIHRVVGKTGATFLGLMDALIEQDRPDIVWLDPLFGFSGCDLMNAEKAGRFLREGLFPIVVKRKVGLIVVHHVGKPPKKDNDGEPMSEIDYQYLGFGSSEIQNAFRSVNILVPVKGTHVFKLVLSKRGERAGAKDLEGEWARSIYLEHSTEGIYWIQTDKPEPVKRGRKTEFKGEQILDELSVINGIKTNALYKRIHDECNMSRGTFYELFAELKREKKVVWLAPDGWIKAKSPESPEESNNELLDQ